MSSPSEPAPFPYITDIEFPSRYTANQAPAMLSYVAAIGGYRPPPPAGAYTYCELGCGAGVTLNTLAASNPQARFIGVDINASHIQRARSVAEAGSLENVTYVEASFDDLAEHDLPAFDYVTIQGTYSWLGPETTSAINTWLGSHLKAGGLFYVHYLGLPGYAQLDPLWQLMRELTRAHSGSSAERAAEGLRILELLRDRGAAFFVVNPRATELLAYLTERCRRDPRFLNHVAHVALAEHSIPHYFAQMAKALAPAGLRYAGSTVLMNNDREIAFPPDLRSTVADIEDAGALEALKDYAIDRDARFDVFVKDAERDPAGAEEHLRQHLYVFMRAAPNLDRAPFQMTPEFRKARDALMGQLPGRVARLADLEAACEVQAITAGDLLETLKRLLISGAFFICARRGEETGSGPGLGEGASLSMPLPYNRTMLARAADDVCPATMASTVVGGGCVPINGIEALLLRDLLDGRKQGTIDSTIKRVQKLGRAVEVEGQRFLSPAAVNRALVTRLLDRLHSGKLRNMIRLEVVEAGRR
ncbi:MAG: methyltransferase domain-containing protein [Planctomycetota bacterium]|jgi:SAM-dependent methyltransferase